MSVERRITDDSEKYAMMCKKANEYIQTQIHPNKLVYARLKDSDEEPAVHIVTAENIDKLIEPTRVFSQREIERLVYEPDKTTVQNFIDMAEWVEKRKDKHYLIINSTEQLMLCYLMEKVYMKLWDGEEWVSEY